MNTKETKIAINSKKTKMALTCYCRDLGRLIRLGHGWRGWRSLAKQNLRNASIVMISIKTYQDLQIINIVICN